MQLAEKQSQTDGQLDRRTILTA